ncbi:NAD(P)-binding protein [Edwardsiella piscicida]|nr:NAD(P)-binding protein [Edwardsiella piscicida]
MIIGAGPAGMEAARVAALRGHRVTLYDRAPVLGGRIRLAAMIKGCDVENVLPSMIGSAHSWPNPRLLYA